MARGRLINKKISLNKGFNEILKSDTSRMLYMLTIAHLDCEGRILGDPFTLKNIILPRREDIKKKDVETYIKEWVTAGFVKWYEIDNEKYIWFPGFDKNQPNLRKDREIPSNIPEYDEKYDVDISGMNPELIRNESGVNPDRLRPKINLSEDKININKDNINKVCDSDESPGKTDIVKSVFEENRKTFHKLLWSCFIKISPDHFLTKKDKGREAPAIKEMINFALARAPTLEGQKEFLGNFLRTAKYVFNGEIKSFLKGSPFIPSVIMSKGIKPRILEIMKDKIKQYEIVKDYEVPW